MASDSPQSPSKKRKQTASSPRETPHSPSGHSLQQPPDFLTDSLFVPSPSPASLPRNEDNQRLSRRGGLARKSSLPVAREGRGTPVSADALHRSNPGSSGRPHHGRSLTDAAEVSKAAQNRSPTPPRGRDFSIKSIVESEASPARGLAEVYQRINEEETLTHDDSLNDLDLDIRESLALTPSFSSDHKQRAAGSNPSSKVSRKSSPSSHIPTSLLDSSRDQENDEDSLPIHVSNAMDEDSTSSSLVSVPSQFAKNLHRLHGALNSGPKAFRKAQPRGYRGSSLENLRRRNGSNESLQSSLSSGSFSQRALDEPLNVPRTWASKSRPGTDWLQRIHEKKQNENMANNASLIAPDADKQNEARTKDRDQKSAKASFEPSYNRSPALFPPRSSHVTQHHPPGWKMDDDFTGRSVEISDSPPMRLRNSSSVSPSAAPGQGTTPRKANEDQKVKQEEPIQGTDRGSNGVGLADFANSPNNTSEEPSEQKEAALMAHGSDSQSLLKRLSRAASLSPSPDEQGASATIRATASQRRMQETPADNQKRLNMKTPVVTGAWVEKNLQDIPESSIPKTYGKTPRVTGGWIDTPRADAAQTDLSVSQNNRKESSHRAAELVKKLTSTPETSPAKKAQSHEPLPYTGPPLPKSTLDNILRQVRGQEVLPIPKDEDPTLRLGEETIQSLEELVANDTDVSTILPPTPPSEQTSPPSSDPSPDGKALLPAKRPMEVQSYAKLLSRLGNLAPSIRDSKKNLSSLERAVSTGRSANSTAAQGDGSSWSCASCGCPGGRASRPLILVTSEGSMSSLTIPIPRLWRWNRDDKLPRLTWLGLATVVIWLLLLAEYWARARFCHPLYATSMVGYGVDINAPEPPFVLFKVLYQRTMMGNLLLPLKVVWRMGYGLIVAFVEYLVEFVFSREGVGAKPASQDQRIPRPSWAPDLSMMNDEFV